MSMTIPLTRGLVALVDDDLYPILAQHRWYARQDGYAARDVGHASLGKVPRQRFRLHREVLRLRGIVVPEGMTVDHINRNRTDDRTENLRVVSQQTNLQNASLRSDNASGYRGVSRAKGGRWQACLSEGGKTRHLGKFPTPEAASDAYVAACQRLGRDAGQTTRTASITQPAP